MQFCGDVPPGNARAKECLEQHRSEANFSTACKDELETMIIARSADFRLDPQLKTHCVKDIEELCMPSYYEVADLPDDHAEVITCLQDFRYVACSSCSVLGSMLQRNDLCSSCRLYWYVKSRVQRVSSTEACLCNL